MKKLLAAITVILALTAQVAPGPTPVPSNTPAPAVFPSSAPNYLYNFPAGISLGVPLLPASGGIGDTSFAGPQIQPGDLIIGLGDSITASGGPQTYTGPVGSPTTGGSGGGTGPYTPSGTGWLDLLGEHYGAQVMNLGYGGTCNQATPSPNYCSTGSSVYARYQNAYTNGNAGFGGLLALHGAAHTWVTYLDGINDLIHMDPAVNQANDYLTRNAVLSYLKTQGYQMNHVIMLPMTPLNPVANTAAYDSLYPQFQADTAQLAVQYGTLAADTYTHQLRCWPGAAGFSTVTNPCSTDELHPNLIGNQQLAADVEQASYEQGVSMYTEFTSLSAVQSYPALVQNATAPTFNADTNAIAVYLANPSPTNAAGIVAIDFKGPTQESKIGTYAGAMEIYDATHAINDVTWDIAGNLQGGKGAVFPGLVTVGQTLPAGVDLTLGSGTALAALELDGNAQTTRLGTYSGVVSGITGAVFNIYDVQSSRHDLAVDVAGNVGVNALVATTIRTNGSTGPTWTAGAGAPSGVCTNGSIYSNTGASAVSTTLYACRGNAWFAMTGG